MSDHYKRMHEAAYAEARYMEDRLGLPEFHSKNVFASDYETAAVLRLAAIRQVPGLDKWLKENTEADFLRLPHWWSSKSSPALTWPKVFKELGFESAVERCD